MEYHELYKIYIIEFYHKALSLENWNDNVYEVSMFTEHIKELPYIIVNGAKIVCDVFIKCYTI